MLNLLHQVEKEILTLLDKPEWNSLYINYEHPFVERLWIPYGDCRVYLHKVHPCDKALMHPHPWPQAVRVISGLYEMGVGWSEGSDWENPPPISAKIIVDAVVIGEIGFTYEMLNRNGWHYVRPLNEPVYSLMVTGKPWGRATPKSDHKLAPLAEEAANNLKNFFRQHYSYMQNTQFLPSK